MGEKDDYDRAWERRVKDFTAPADSFENSSRRARSRTGPILLGLGLIVSALGAEALAVYNACFANPICYPSLSGDGWEGFFAVLAAGLVLAETGVILLLPRTSDSSDSRRQFR